jgi:hypothetical protein
VAEVVVDKDVVDGRKEPVQVHKARTGGLIAAFPILHSNKKPSPETAGVF